MSYSMTTRVYGRRSLLGFLSDIWRYRHLCVQLAKADLESRFRRSSLGVLWAMIHPLAFSMLYALVLANLFKQDFREFSLYVMSGLVLWDAIAASVNQGAYSLVNAGGYLKQAAIPIVLFPLRTSLTIMAVFLLGMAGYALYATGVHFLFGARFVFSIQWFWGVPFALTLFLFVVPWATIAAITNVKFRDTQQLLIIATQAVWFASPIFLARELFDSPYLRIWSAINPVRAFCDVLRDAVLYARVPELSDWAVIGVWIGVSWTIASLMLVTTGRKVVFSL